MYGNAKRGWYKVINKHKVMKPVDGHMKSFMVEDGNVFLEYKSSLELKSVRYADYNKHVVKFSVEPFHIKYNKPTDGKIHRYFIDMFLEFSTGDKFIVEIKSSSETRRPRRPSKQTEKSIRNYQRACQTFAVNQAKWAAAEEFAKRNSMQFILLTEKELG